MSTVTWILIDTEEGIDLREWSAGPGDVDGLPGGWHISKRQLVGGKQDGVSVVDVDNGSLRFRLLPTRGMGVWRAWKGDRQLGWSSPVRGPVHPAFVPVMDPGGLGWLEGFDELLVRCGLKSNGAPEFDADGRLRYPLHGRIANLPAHRVAVTVDSQRQTLSVTGEIDETRFLFHHLRLTSTITTQPETDGFEVCDVVQNCAATETTFQMLYHINVGPPLLGEGATLAAPVRAIIPRTAVAAENIAGWNSYGPPQQGFAEQVYFFDLLGDADGNTQVLLKNPGGNEGVFLAFSLRELPCFIQWKNTGPLAEGYVTGIEPAVNLPNPHSFEAEQGRVIRLGPGESHPLRFSLRWLAGREHIAEAEQAIMRLQGDITPRLFDAPQPGWCCDE